MNKKIVFSTLLMITIFMVGIIPVKALDEVSIGGQKVPVVTSGDGLYSDGYETGRYAYRGANPNNYIMFNQELWRIISKENDGTYKIIRNDILENRSYDKTGLRDKNASIGGTYCSKGSGGGCNAWATSDSFTNGSVTGTVLKDAELNTYLNTTYLDSISSDMIVLHDWNIGYVQFDNRDLPGQIETEHGNQSSGKVGLISHSEYIRANSNLGLCGSDKQNYQNPASCRKTNWMYLDDANFWSLSPAAAVNSVYVATTDGYMDYPKNIQATNSTGVRPVVYLTPKLQVYGKGTKEDPFIIEDISINQPSHGKAEYTVDENGVVTISTEANEGYTLASIEVLGSDNKEITIDENNQFTLPKDGIADITVRYRAIQYKLESGKDANFVGEDLTFTFDDGLSLLDKVLVNGKELDSSYYTVDEDTKSVILNKKYLETLDPDTYEIVFKFTNGTSITTSFKIAKEEEPSKDDEKDDSVVEDAKNPDTSDKILLYFLLDAMSVAGLVALGVYCKRRRA